MKVPPIPEGDPCRLCQQTGHPLDNSGLCPDCLKSAQAFFESQMGDHRANVDDADELVRLVSEAKEAEGIAEVLGRFRPPTDPMELNVLRERLIKAITTKVKAPAKMIDAWIGTTAGRDEQELVMAEATLLCSLALANCNLFHSPGGEPYAVIRVDDHEENHRLTKRTFERWLRKLFFDQATADASQQRPGYLGVFAKNRAPQAQAVRDAVAQLAAIAVFAGEEQEVHYRIAPFGRELVYLDLGSKVWNAVEITPTGWKVIDNPPVRFVRGEGMLALPYPEQGGDLATLRNFVNVSDADWPLLAGHVIGQFNPAGPYTILNLTGEHGTGKSTAAECVRKLVDPYTPLHRGRPRNEHELAISAELSWVMSYDNLGSIAEWLSDAFCRLSTGGGFGARMLYTDDEERRFEATRPIILNGIEDVATRGDLLDRSIIINLPNLQVRPESEIRQAFEKAWPELLGACLDAASMALRRRYTVEIGVFPRMADFTRWAVAAEPVMGVEEGAFLEAYRANRRHASNLVLEMSLVGAAVMEYLKDRAQWSGSASELLKALNLVTLDATQRAQEWPKAGHALAGKLKRLAPNLRAAGIEVTFGRTGRARTLTLTKIATAEEPEADEEDPDEEAVREYRDGQLRNPDDEDPGF